MKSLQCVTILFILGSQGANATDAISDFGFGAGGESSLFRPDANYQELFHKSSDFDYDGQWNGQFNNLNNVTACAATSVGNNVAIETQGSGNTVYILNSQQNSNASINSLCSLGE